MSKIESMQLTRVYRNTHDREGNPLLDRKTKKPITGIGIWTNLYGDRWINGEIKYAKDPRMEWTEGMVVDIVVESRGDYLYFRLPNRLDRLEEEVKTIKKHLNMETTEQEDAVEDYSDGIPF